MMNNQSLVSVIIIFLNAEQFIHEAVESVLAQTYGMWELLLVDDGSVDGSVAIARCYAEHHPERIRYVEHPAHQNRGMSASRNLGIFHARGEYIAFLDADDVWLPHKLEQQVAILKRMPEAGMVFGPTEWWYGWTGKPDDIARDFLHELGMQPNVLLGPGELLAHFLPKESISPCTCSLLLRRHLVEQVGGFEKKFRGLYEDQAFLAKVSLITSVFVSPVQVARYRQHKDSNCAVVGQNGGYLAARKTFLTWLVGYLQTQNYRDQEVWQSLRHELRLIKPSMLGRLYRFARQSFIGKAYRSVLKLKTGWRALPVIRQLRAIQLRRLKPIHGGRQQGTPVVRYYWANFLQKHKADIQGTVLEIGTTRTVLHYGGKNVVRADAMDLTAHSAEVTVVSDLSRADNIPSNHYDCFVNQFTTHLIYDIESALYHSIRILKPGGVLLINFPCVDYYFSHGLDMGTGQPLFMYWWFTPIQVENYLRRAGLSEGDYALDCHGNLFARIAYQVNMPAEELTQKELTFYDPGHPLLICARVVKPGAWQGEKPPYRMPWRPAVPAAQWNEETGHYAE